MLAMEYSAAHNAYLDDAADTVTGHVVQRVSEELMYAFGEENRIGQTPPTPLQLRRLRDHRIAVLQAAAAATHDLKNTARRAVEMCHAATTAHGAPDLTDLARYILRDFRREVAVHATICNLP